MSKPDITAEHIRQVLDYDAGTGIFIWKTRQGQRGVVGTVAGSKTKLGYWTVQLFGIKYPAHRLAWCYMTGAWPVNHIDHIDGNPSNNTIDNLRDVTQTGNNQNQKSAHSQNVSKLLGVSRHKQGWQAEIQVDGVRHYLGLFDTPVAAHTAYIAAKRKLHGTCTI